MTTNDLISRIKELAETERLLIELQDQAKQLSDRNLKVMAENKALADENETLKQQIATMQGHPDVVAAARAKKEQEYKALQESLKAMSEELGAQP